MGNKIFVGFIWTVAFISVLVSFYAAIKGSYTIANYHLLLGALSFWLAKEVQE